VWALSIYRSRAVSSNTIVARAEGSTYAAKVWALSIYRSRAVSSNMIVGPLRVPDGGKGVWLPDGSNADFFHNRGFSHRKRGAFEAAVDDYTTAIRLNPQHCRAYYNRAFSYDRCADTPRAWEDWAPHDMPERESGANGLTRAVETPLAFKSPPIRPAYVIPVDTITVLCYTALGSPG
jgi:tetratricopeptide (TPR) repeat protein